MILGKSNPADTPLKTKFIVSDSILVTKIHLFKYLQFEMLPAYCLLPLMLTYLMKLYGTQTREDHLCDRNFMSYPVMCISHHACTPHDSRSYYCIVKDITVLHNHNGIWTEASSKKKLWTKCHPSCNILTFVQKSNCIPLTVIIGACLPCPKSCYSAAQVDCV